MPISTLGLTAESYKSDAVLSMVHEKVIQSRIYDVINNALPELKLMIGVDQDGFAVTREDADTRDAGIVVEGAGRLHMETGGSSIDIEVEYEENNTVAAYSRYGLIDTTPQEGFTRVFQDWSQYAASTVIDGFSERVNGSAESFFKILSAKTDQTLKSFRNRIADDLWLQDNAVVSDPLILTGIPYYVSTTPTSGTAANVNRATNSWYRNVFNGVGGAVTATAPSFAERGVEDLFTMFLAAGAGAGVEEIDVWLVNAQEMNRIFQRMSNSIMYTSTENGDPFFNSINMLGKPVIWTKKAPAGRIYGLNMDSWSVHVHSRANFTPRPFQTPDDQDARVALTLLQIAIVNNNPRRNLVYSGIAA